MGPRELGCVGLDLAALGGHLDKHGGTVIPGLVLSWVVYAVSAYQGDIHK